MRIFTSGSDGKKFAISGNALVTLGKKFSPRQVTFHGSPGGGSETRKIYKSFLLGSIFHPSVDIPLHCAYFISQKSIYKSK